MSVRAGRQNGASFNADHFVYRCYDKDGDLIYIGCTVNVKKRIGEHKRGGRKHPASRWLAVSMVRHEIEGPFPGLRAGRKAEAAGIRLEQPVFNTQWRREANSSIYRGGAARYLVERGHLALALETACTCHDILADLGSCAPWCEPHVVEGVLPIYEIGAEWCEGMEDAS